MLRISSNRPLRKSLLKNFPSSDKPASGPEKKEKDFLSRKYEKQYKDPGPLGPDLYIKGVGISSNIHVVHLLFSQVSWK